MQAVLDGMQDGVTVVDRNGRFTLRNAAAERIAGISPQHISAVDWSRALGVCLADGVTPLPDDRMPVSRALRGETVDWLDLFVKHLCRGAASIRCGR
jgi:PAS domain-containing protein